MEHTHTQHIHTIYFTIWSELHSKLIKLPIKMFVTGKTKRIKKSKTCFIIHNFVKKIEKKKSWNEQNF